MTIHKDARVDEIRIQMTADDGRMLAELRKPVEMSWSLDKEKPPSASKKSLSIGSAAPPIDIAHWFHQKEPVAAFEAGKVFVVEFWATWCGPCVASMPHLRDLQEKHGNDICVISVSDEPPETIEQFLDREHGETTFREVTSKYWLATDPDGSVKRDYMTAADQRGIPTAFIVGKTGEIEWIGHPMQIDDALACILAGEWDRDAYAKQMEEKEEVSRQLRLVYEKVRQNKPADALPMLERLVAQAPSPEARAMYEAAQRRVRMEIERLAQAPGGQNGGRVTHVEIQQLEVGDQVTVRLTGRTNGALWGDSIYTLDSDLATAAVHAGLLRPGETKAIKVWVVPAPESFSGANRNGVQSSKWGRFRAAFIMQAAVPAAPRVVRFTPPRNALNVSALAIGESKTITVTGADRGPLWGSDTYTSDSHVAAAAAHCGALRVGETGEVVVTRVAPPAQFEGNVRNGVRSSPWGAYPSAFTVKPAVEKDP